MPTSKFCADVDVPVFSVATGMPCALARLIMGSYSDGAIGTVSMALSFWPIACCMPSAICLPSGQNGRWFSSGRTPWKDKIG